MPRVLQPSAQAAVLQVMQAVFERGQRTDQALRVAIGSSPAVSRWAPFWVPVARAWIRYARLVEGVAGREVVGARDYWGATCRYLPVALPDLDLPRGDLSDAEWRESRARRERLTRVRAIRESVPDWLDQLGSSQWGDRWPELLGALNQEAPLFLRVNENRGAIGHLHHLLAGAGLEVSRVADCPGVLQVPAGSAVFSCDAFARGCFEVQDLSSQEVSVFLGPQPGERVLDACAGQGGKSLHLSALMRNRGTVVAVDVDPGKLKRLRLRATRAGADNIEVRPEWASVAPARFAGRFDRVLIDAPCTGSGTWRRNPGAKWELREDSLRSLPELQGALLRRYAGAVRPGGTLVYATCSWIRAENEGVVEGFLRESPNWSLEEKRALLPDRFPGDGFFMARLRRGGGSESGSQAEPEAAPGSRVP